MRWIKKNKPVVIDDTTTKVNLVRYADDFIITAKTKEIAEEIKDLVSLFLKIRGLTLSEKKDKNHAYRYWL